MPIRKSIRDIQTSNKISDIVSVQAVEITRNKKTNTSQEIVPEVIEEVFAPTPQTQSNIKSKIATGLSKAIKTLSQIKTIYLIAFVIILTGITILIFIPSGTQKDPVEQAKKEAEVVKKQFSKHIVLPESEQIDIRKKTLSLKMLKSEIIL